jgi:uncharacterized protein YjiK
MKNILQYSLLLLITALTVISSCGNNQKVKPSSDSATTISQKKGSYDLNKVEKSEMKKKLKEISGIHYLKDNLFVAIQDESGKIFTVSFPDGKITEVLIFGDKGDYEDVTLDEHYYYVLESVGKIYRVPRNGDTSRVKIFEIPFKKHMEFESLYIDQGGNDLMMICKNCPGKKKDNLTKYAYAFDLKKETFADDPLFIIDLSTMPGVKNLDDLDVKPSATAIHPIEKKLYVLCSVGKMLLVCDLKGKIEQAWPLDPQVYKQPEGIAFTPNGDMYISNESAGNEKGNILKLVYKK